MKSIVFLSRFLLAAELVVALVSCGGGSAPVSSYQPAAATPAHLGANLPGISDYSPTPVYADLMNQARPFGSASQPWIALPQYDAKTGTQIDANGWPSGDFGVVLMTGQAGVSNIAGTYKASFTGRATVNLVAATTAKIRNRNYDPAKNLTTFDIVLPQDAGSSLPMASTESQIMLGFTNTGSGISNLEVIRPGYDPANPPLFTSEFLNHIARFHTLRFMDWLNTNNSTVTAWTDRTDPLKSHYAAASGVPWEHVVALANLAGKDIWINIPVSADDNYVTQLAALLKAYLNPGNKIYVEYSNEIWNGGSFTQYGMNLNSAKADPSLSYDNPGDPNVLWMRRVAKRLMQISDIFRGVYGDAAMMTTVRPVLAGATNPYILQQGLLFADPATNASLPAGSPPPSHYFYAIAEAPYFDMGANQTIDGLTTDQVIQSLQGSLPTNRSYETINAIASWYGLTLLAYEGGPDTFGPGSIVSKKAASLDPRMKDMCISYLATWYGSGGGMFMWYTAGAGNWDTRYGTWQLTTDLSITAPKTQCMDAILASSPPAPTATTIRNTIPGTFNAWAYALNSNGYANFSATAVQYLHPGNYVEYLIAAPASGAYSLVLNASAAQAGNTVDVAANHNVMAAAFGLAAGNNNDNAPISLQLRKGLNALRITTRAETSGYSLSTLTIR